MRGSIEKDAAAQRKERPQAKRTGRFRVLTAFVTTAAFVACGCERADLDWFPLAEGNVWKYSLMEKESYAGRMTGTRAPEYAGALEASSGRKAVARDAGGPIGNGGQHPKAGSGDPTGAGIGVGLGESLSLKPIAEVALEITEKLRPFVFKAVFRNSEQVWAKEDDFLCVQDAAGRHYMLMLPPHTGYRWAEQDPSGRTRYYEIEGREDVATAAGRFAGCVRVREEDRLKTCRKIYWYAPGVGLVRRSEYSGTGEEISRAEVVYFRVRPSEDGPLPPWQWKLKVGKKAPGKDVRRSAAAEAIDVDGAVIGSGPGAEHETGGGTKSP